MSFPVLEPFSVNRSRVPSGEKDVGNCPFALSVSRSTAPVPSAVCQYRLDERGDPRVERKGNPSSVRRPDGEAHPTRVEGQPRQRCAAEVPDPDVFSWSRTSSATFVPSGEIRGFVYARGGALSGLLAPLPIDPHQRRSTPP